MSINRNSNTQLWDICFPIAFELCNEAQKQNSDINSTIYPFRVLLPYNIIDIEDWNDVLNFITIAVYNLSLYYISKNMPAIIKSKCISK